MLISNPNRNTTRNSQISTDINWCITDRGRTWYDVSAIDSHDNNGVKFVRPEYHWNVPNAISGCDVFPCPNAYLVHDSPKQTRDTEDTDLVVSIGNW